MGFGDFAEHLPGRGPYVFKISGEVYHSTGNLQPQPGRNSAYVSLFVYDSLDEAANQRSNNPYNEGCDPGLMRLLTGVIHAHHHYAGIYKQIWQLTREQPAHRLSMVIRQNRTLDPRRYNCPTNDELALIFPGEGLNRERDIVVHRAHENGGIERISTWNPAYITLHYVLLLIFGEHGYHRGIPVRNAPWVPGFAQRGAGGNNSDNGSNGHADNDPPIQGGRRATVTELEYYAYMLFPREFFTSEDAMPGPDVHFGTIFRACRLFQHFLVDIWAIIDQARLIWMRMNQATIWRDLYLGLVDALHTINFVAGANQGTILASSYYGGARQMAESYQDAMAIARYLGPPQFFVTMTANPNWPELKNALLPGQVPADRPDLAVRVFELKRRALLHDIAKKHVLGRCIAHVHTIEFQKRGLPHMHLLVWVERASHLMTPDDVDEVISAEIPDLADRDLYGTVTTSMLHGPCGPNFPNASCWDAEKQVCKKGYWPLKPWCPTTTMIPNSYQQYCRRNNGWTFTKRFGGQELTFDNQSVVPHSPFLSRQYNCHINVETCSGINAIKYIFKYVYKGRDRVSIEITNQQEQQAVDEIKIHLDTCWVSPYEAMWRISRFSLHQEVPNIYRLQVHLPDQEIIVFRGDDLIQDMIANRKDTMLTSYFKLNAHQNQEVRNLARSMVYQEIPSKLLWNKKVHVWNLRRQAAAASPHTKGAIGRMYFVGINQGEKFYLRLLLTTVKGATSFEALRTYNGVVHPTFQACFTARGLLEHDGEWAQCLEEASVIKTGYQLRKLFVVILTFGNPTDPLKLWDDYKVHICDDLRHRIVQEGWDIPDITDEKVYDNGLYLLEKIVIKAGSTMETVKLPKSVGRWAEYEGQGRIFLEQIQLQQAIPEGEPETLVGQLNIQQLDAFNKVYTSAVESHGQTFFLDSPAGTGKTFLYKTLGSKLRSEGHYVICVASSGIASLLLPGGRTSHSRFSIPLKIHETSTCSISKQSHLAQLIHQTKLIVWDEVPMQHRFCAEAFNRTCQDICSKPDQLFGGITVVFGGEFRQILPVIPHGEPEQIIAACLKRSPLWPQMHKLRLTENMLLQGDPEAAEFANFLLQVGEGVSIQEGHDGPVEFNPNMHVSSQAELIDGVYPNLSTAGQQFSNEFLQERTILAGRNDDVLLLNNNILDKFPGKKRELSTEYLNTLNSASIPVSKLELKVGCPIMILHNLAPSQGVCNGTQAIVVHAGQRVLEVRLLTGSHTGNTVFLPPMTLSTEESDFGFVMDRRQFPVRLAFAMTINKSQGQSVKYIGLDFENAVFVKATPSRLRPNTYEAMADLWAMMAEGQTATSKGGRTSKGKGKARARNANALIGQRNDQPVPRFAPQKPKFEKVKRPPSQVGARICTHCNGDHWDNECPKSRKNQRQVRANLAATDADGLAAQEAHDELYENLSSNESSDSSEDPFCDSETEKPSENASSSSESDFESPSNVLSAATSSDTPITESEVLSDVLEGNSEGQAQVGIASAKSLNIRTSSQHLANQIIPKLPSRRQLTKHYKLAKKHAYLGHTTIGSKVVLRRISSRPPGTHWMGTKSSVISGWIGPVKGDPTKIIFDSGSEITLMTVHIGQGVRIIQVKGNTETKNYITVPFTFETPQGQVEMLVDAYIVPDMTTGFLLGNDFSNQYQLSLIRESNHSYVKAGSSNQQIPVIGTSTDPRTDSAGSFRVETIPLNTCPKRHKKSLKTALKQAPPGTVPVRIYKTITIAPEGLISNRSEEDLFGITDCIISANNPKLQIANFT
ncbi:ATP-dependent DNA helicase PIF1 [Ceratobasidium sp. AG-Ba]|nr:ATP-dependent DNA helicase PIF1 [Ceratobasidium sp. AG-Ba]